jgi:dipeptide transport system ATP-binding protein
MILLQVDNLSVELAVPGGHIRALDNFSLRVEHGSYHGIIGESGSGKSIAMSAIMGLLHNTTRLAADRMSLKGEDLLAMPAKRRRQTLYQNVSIIFQEPENSLNPCYRIGYQLNETLAVHGYSSASKREERAKELLSDVGINETDVILDSYPHQLTPALLQRIMIAIALASDPELLIADEPTTELAPSEQFQIMQLLNDLVKQRNMAMILISHDMKLLRKVTDHVTILYCGQVIESGPKDIIFSEPKHPYTKSILDSEPAHWDLEPKTLVPSLPGSTPSLHHLPVGCYLGPRCPYAEAKCVQSPEPVFDDSQHMIRCHFPGGWLRER